jgi:uncharacterized hydantoinase/oxoprolinase family protein
MDIILISVNILLIGTIVFMGERHSDDLADLYEVHQEEREKLLDRIMANNIQEYKTANGLNDIKRSNSGNYLVDRMEKTIKNKFQDME